MDSDLVLTNVRDGVMTITLNRPTVLNSFNGAMAIALLQALGQAAEDVAVRALLLTANGRAFCAGQDLADALPDADGTMPDLGHIVEHFYNPIILGIRTLEKPVVCAVNGVAAGAGCNFALACDLVIATESASFLQPFCKLGLIPDTGGSYFLPRLVGTQRAMGLALLGDKLSAKRAAEIGLIFECVADAQFAARIDAVAAQLASGPTLGYARTKQAIYASPNNTLDAQLALEGTLMRECGFSEDYREGVAAFKEKRAALFKGR